ncbi:MAG: cupredoxin domain-containing protein [Patescibacteria group bacterium]|nr:cupredoxin domain-containing protein [Patescibacteria group bacterium]
MNNLKYLIGLVIVAALIYGGVMYSKKPAETKPAEPIMIDEAGVKVFNVSGANFRFDPVTITVKKGDQVKIIFESLDMQHDLDIDEFDVNSPVIPAGESSEIEFTADQVGEFEYYCSVGSHRANGMVGTLIVE